MSTRPRFRGCCVLGLSGWLVWSAAALADPEPPQAAIEAASSDQLAAREDFREASRLAQVGDWAGALARYSLSHSRFPHATTLYNIGYCRERLGDPAAAVRDTQGALVFEARFPGRGLSDELRARATAALSELEAKVSRVEIVSLSDHLVLRVDGQPLETFLVAGKLVGFAESDGAPSSFSPVSGSLVLTLNHGPHVLDWQSEAGAGSRRVELGPGSQAQRLTLPEPVASPPLATREPARPPPALAPAAVPTPPATAAGPLRPYGIAALVAAGGAALLGVGAGWLAHETNDELATRCSSDGACPQSQAERIDRFQVQTTVATVAFVSAAALTGAGITLLLLDSPSKERAALELRLSSQLVVKGRF